LYEQIGRPQHTLDKWGKLTGRGKKGLVLRHRCGYSMCCNYKHIKLGTRTQNEADKHFHAFNTSLDAKDVLWRDFPETRKLW
jgi:hypothetical protein